MLVAVSALIGCPVEARDGRVGDVRDLLLDERSWTVRWLLVTAGDWLPGRKILVRPSAVGPIRLPPKPAFPMLSFGERMALPLELTRAQIEAGPEAAVDEPVTDDLERRFSEHFGWDPLVGDGARAGGAAELKGFSIEAADGDAGSLDNLFVDDLRWEAVAFVVATRGWLRSRLVRVPAAAVVAVDRPARRLRVSAPRERIETAPVWDPLAIMADDLAEERLRAHFRAAAPPR